MCVGDGVWEAGNYREMLARLWLVGPEEKHKAIFNVNIRTGLFLQSHICRLLPSPWPCGIQAPGRKVPWEALGRRGLDGWGAETLDEDEAVDLGAGAVRELPTPLPRPSAPGVAGRLPQQQLVP